jgi:hypothetical protein
VGRLRLTRGRGERLPYPNAGIWGAIHIVLVRPGLPAHLQGETVNWHTLNRLSAAYLVVAIILAVVGFGILVSFFGMLFFYFGFEEHSLSFLVILPIGTLFMFFGALVGDIDSSTAKKGIDSTESLQIARIVSFWLAVLSIPAFASYAYSGYKNIAEASKYRVSSQSEGISVTGLGVPNGQLKVRINAGGTTLRGANTAAPYYAITGDIKVSQAGEQSTESITHVNAGNISDSIASYNGGFQSVRIPDISEDIRIPAQIKGNSPILQVVFSGNVDSTHETGTDSFGVDRQRVEYQVKLPVSPYHGPVLPDMDEIELHYIFQFALFFSLSSAPLLLIGVEKNLRSGNSLWKNLSR